VLLNLVTVNIRRDARPRVAEPATDGQHIDASGDELAAIEVPQIVQAHAGDLRCLAEPDELARERLQCPWLVAAVIGDLVSTATSA